MKAVNAFNMWLETEQAQQVIAAAGEGLQFLGQIIGRLVTIVRNAVGLIVSVLQGDFAGAFDYARQLVESVIEYIQAGLGARSWTSLFI